jgi:hypothetical protein
VPNQNRASTRWIDRAQWTQTERSLDIKCNISDGRRAGSCVAKEVVCEPSATISNSSRACQLLGRSASVPGKEKS